MKRFVNFIPSITISLTAATFGLAAGEAPSQQDASPFLDGPDIVKLNWSVRIPQVGDLNNDGLMDIALVNNNQAKIEFLLQKKPGEQTAPVGDVLPKKDWEPILEHDRFTRSFTVIGQNAYHLELADFNGDERTDLAITGNRDPFSIYLQQEDGSFEQDWTFESIQLVQRSNNFILDDIDLDGALDVILLGTENIVVLHKKTDATDFRPTFLPIEENAGAYLQLADVDLNGRKDLIYLVNGIKTQYIGIRLQTEQGDFGPEIPIPFPYTNFIVMDEDPKEGPLFGISDPMSGMIRAFRIQPSAHDTREDFSHFPVQSFNSGEARKHASLYAFADLENNGLVDIFIGAPERAEILVYRQVKPGQFLPPKAYPSFKGLTSLAFHRDAEGQLYLLQLSDEEQLLGISPIDAQGGIPFPTLLPLENEPVMLVQFEQAGDLPAPVVLSKKKRKYFINEYSQDESGKWQSSETELEDVDSDPNDMLYWKRADGRPAIAIYTAREAAIFLVRNDEGGWDTLGKNSSLRQSVLKNLQPQRTSLEDWDEDGTADILLSEDGFTRVIRWNEELEDFEIIVQFNAPQKDQSMISPNAMGWIRAGSLGFYDPKPSRLYIMDTDENAQYSASQYLNLPSLRLLFQRSIDLGEGRKAQLLAGERRFHLIDPSAQAWEVEWMPGQFTSGEDENRFHFLFPLKRIATEAPQWVIIDAKRNELFILQPDWEHAWENLMEFKLFDSNARGNPNAGGSLQPREINAVDFDLDGKDDLLMLIHDRLLIYY